MSDGAHFGAHRLPMPALDLQHISKTYAPHPRSWRDRLRGRPAPAGFQALRDVSLAIEHGEFFGLLGPNGAGKTSLISILAGLSHATRGSARVCGYDVVEDFRRACQWLGVVPQELVYDSFFTVCET